MGLRKILSQVQDTDRLKVLAYRGPLPFDYDSLLPLMFNGGMPDNLTRNLSFEEEHILKNYTEFEVKPTWWQKVKGYFTPHKNSRILLDSCFD